MKAFSVEVKAEPVPVGRVLEDQVSFEKCGMVKQLQKFEFSLSGHVQCLAEVQSCRAFYRAELLVYPPSC